MLNQMFFFAFLASLCWTFLYFSAPAFPGDLEMALEWDMINSIHIVISEKNKQKILFLTHFTNPLFYCLVNKGFRLIFPENLTWNRLQLKRSYLLLYRVRPENFLGELFKNRFYGLSCKLICRIVNLSLLKESTFL